jgi:hypothetical protein
VRKYKNLHYRTLSLVPYLLLLLLLLLVVVVVVVVVVIVLNQTHFHPPGASIIQG